MSCCSRHTRMIFTDPRMRSPSAMGHFGLTWACNDVDAALDELKQLLNKAEEVGILTTHWFSADEGDSVALQAQATYKGIINNNLVIMSDDACVANTNEARAASRRLSERLAQVGATVPEPLRPDYEHQESQDPIEKAKPIVIAVGVIAGAVVLAPIVFEIVASVRAARRGFRGYRRRRSRR